MSREQKAKGVREPRNRGTSGGPHGVKYNKTRLDCAGRHICRPTGITHLHECRKLIPLLLVKG